MKEKSKEKTVIGKQYPSLDKSEQDVRQTMTALSYIRECAVSNLFDDEDSLGDMDIDSDNFFENMRHIKTFLYMVNFGTILIPLIYKRTSELRINVYKMESYMPFRMEELIYVSSETAHIYLI
jgi:hypothetical protein